jgi:hypothetical protein
MATPTSSDWRWRALRALPAAAVRRALGDAWELYDGGAYGISVRRRGGPWDWPEWALADAARISVEEAGGRLLAADRELREDVRRPGRAGARARVAAFVGGAA